MTPFLIVFNKYNMPKINPTPIDVSQDAAFNRDLAVTPKQPVSDLSKMKLTWTKDKKDDRDYKYRITANDATAIDLRPYCGLVENQGALGSCTGHAITSAMEIILKKQNRLIQLSRLFVYYQERLIEGTINWDAGAYIRDGIKACNKIGAPNENLWRYDIRMYKRKPSSLAYKDAEKRKVTEYQRCDDFEAVKNALANGNPVVVGFLVYSSFMSQATSKTGMMPYPDTRTEKLLGGHAVCLVGFDDSDQRFIVKNSWGTKWGDAGYFYMPYDVIKNTNMSADFWVIKDIT